MIKRFYLYCFLRQLGFFSAVLIPFFTNWGHISLVQIQLLQSWFMLWIFIFDLPTGAIADYLGRKYTLALGGLVVTLAVLLYGSVPKFEVFLIGEFLFALAYALGSGADNALLYDSLIAEGKEHESKKILGRAHAFRLLGVVIAAPIGSLIAKRFGLNAPLLFSAVPFFLSGVVALTIKEPKIKIKKTVRKPYFAIIKEGFLFFCRHKILRLIAIDTILVNTSAYFVIWLYQSVLIKLNFPVAYFGIVHAFFAGCEIVVAGNFLRLEKLFGSAKKFQHNCKLVRLFS